MGLRTRGTLSQSVSAELIARIYSGELGPGDRLTERALTEEFGVGRNAAREAVQHLVALGLVDVRPRRGITVLSQEDREWSAPGEASELLATKSSSDLYAFRMVIECAVAEAAARHRTASQLAEIRRRAHQYVETATSGQVAFSEDLAFHRALAVASHNAIFAEVLAMLATKLEHVRRLTDGVPGTRELAVEQHQVILQAVADRDPEAARLAMHAHIEAAITAMRRAHAS